MAETTTADILAAAADPHLRDRLTAAAAKVGVKDGATLISRDVMAVVCQPVTDQGDTIASVYAYAVAQMPPPPGQNPAAVTDAHLAAAVAAIAQQEVPSV